jgi:hypothetical protein
MAMNKGKERKINWGGARENAGRKSIWNNKETCTMRIPKIFALKLHEIAQKWDKETEIEFDIKSSGEDFDSVIESKQQLSQAIDLAKQILNHKKSARISFAKFLSKFYNVPVKVEDLK